MNWINAQIEKPYADLIVLIHIPNSVEPVWLGYWDDSDGCWRDIDGMQQDVTHWQELPESPK